MSLKGSSESIDNEFDGYPLINEQIIWNNSVHGKPWKSRLLGLKEEIYLS